MMQKANVSHGKTEMDMIVGRRELPCVRLLWSLYIKRLVRGAVLLSMERKKKVMKKQRRSKKSELTKKSIFVDMSGI
jgi:hypothetical protein